MGSTIILKLLNVTHYYRNKKNKKWYLPYNYGADDIELNNISLHIYQGEALGIIGEPNSSKGLVGRILSGEVKPDKGKRASKTDIFFADIADKPLQQFLVSEFVKHRITLFQHKVTDKTTAKIIEQAQLQEKEQTKILDLSDAEYAQLLFTLSQFSKKNILIYNQILQYLNEEFFIKALDLADEYINNNQTIVMIDDDISKIEQASNYIAWISHGQLRKEGSINQVVPLFKEHEKDRNSLETKQQQESFDVDWKKSRSKIPELTYNFKRIERYNHAKAPAIIGRFWVIFITLIFGAIIMALLMFNDLGKLQFAQNVDQANIQNEQKKPYEDKLAYGIALSNKIQLQGLHHKGTVNLKQYSFVTITGENNNNYRIVVDGKDYKTAKNNLRYFDSAGLFEKHSGKKLAPYMQNNYINYYEFFNSNLHKNHNKVTEQLVPETGKDNRFVVPITSQPISMIFDDSNKLTGFVYPMKNQEKLKKEFDIQGNFWIAKSGNGYYMGDFKNNKWIYLEL
ncbi:ATP-binding cassette domain-containing protein [Staphylococcus durrellii]|uniref:ATP-binding cassette domain-containing protein n=1 Tax=Staphylococcus durrellii TaxID=2781773 RepID=UPI00189F481B|nr:ATP-binding cassette domain-containing protein [Staphylococcus durrellii]MBF7016709.1 ABC transporter ATP-binding protein [Staphylococcus durrellii]